MLIDLSILYLNCNLSTSQCDINSQRIVNLPLNHLINYIERGQRFGGKLYYRGHILKHIMMGVMRWIIIIQINSHQ